MQTNFYKLVNVPSKLKRLGVHKLSLGGFIAVSLVNGEPYLHFPDADLFFSGKEDDELGTMFVGERVTVKIDGTEAPLGGSAVNMAEELAATVYGLHVFEQHPLGEHELYNVVEDDFINALTSAFTELINEEFGV